VNSTDLWILWRPPQSLTREPYIVASTKVSVLGIDVDAICADSLGIASILLLVFLGLSMQVGQAVSHRNTNFYTKFNCSSRFTTNHWPYLSLNQVHNAIGHAARLGVQQDALLAVQLADHKKLVPPMSLQARKRCTRGDQGIDSIKIPL
jgi:hypothetical protein